MVGDNERCSEGEGGIDETGSTELVGDNERCSEGEGGVDETGSTELVGDGESCSEEEGGDSVKIDDSCCESEGTVVAWVARTVNLENYDIQ